MYAKIIDDVLVKHPYFIEDMRNDYPELAIDDEPTYEQLTACSAYPAQMGATPTQSSRTHFFTKTFTANEDGSVTINFVPHELDRQIAEFNMRDARNAALTRCDWVMTRAFEEGKAVPDDYLAYRKALRDLTSQEGFPYDYIWPEEPK